MLEQSGQWVRGSQHVAGRPRGGRSLRVGSVRDQLRPHAYPLGNVDDACAAHDHRGCIAESVCDRPSKFFSITVNDRDQVRWIRRRHDYETVARGLICKL